MRIYLDSSALVKLVQVEAESEPLRRYLRGHRGDQQVSAALARVEVVRAVTGGGTEAIARARRQLARLYQVPLDRGLLDEAAALEPVTLRSLDAIHLAAAQRLCPELRALVTYDARMASAAGVLGLTTDAPA